MRVGTIADLLVATVLVIAAQQTIAAGSFDGTYSGIVSINPSSGPNCAWVVGSQPSPTVMDSLTITNNHFDYKVHSAPVSVDLSADGSFQAIGTLRVVSRSIPQEFSGRIVGNTLQATVQGAGGGCQFQLSLKKQ